MVLRRISLFQVALIVFFSGRLFSQIMPDPYQGETPPGDTPVVFAVNKISLPGRYERAITFAPDGREFFFMTTNAGWTSPKIWHSKYSNFQWSEFEVASFSESANCAEPFFSPDGTKLYFTSNRPGSSNFDIWMIEKINNSWSESQRLPSAINSSAGEWHPCVVANGNFYFARNGNLYFSRYEEGAYQKAVALKDINSGANDWDPYVNPNEDYVIFKSNRSGGYGGMDNYISLKNNDGSWSEPMNMGPTINTRYDDDAGDISADGKYMFFSRTVSGNMDIYWVDAGIIDKLRTQTSVGMQNSQVPKQFSLSQNYPNPFNPSTQIAIDVASPCHVTLYVFDALGHQISTLVNERMGMGHYVYEFTADNLSSGIYFYQAQIGGYHIGRKMVLSR